MLDRRESWRRAVPLRLRPRGSPSRIGSERSFDPPIGRHWDPEGETRGYFIDFSEKATSPDWPPSWLRPIERQLHVATAQWGLGAFERYLHGEGTVWLDGARGAAEHLLAHQQGDGRLAGGWPHLSPYAHTFRIDPPWLSAMAQGEGASLLMRLYVETAEDRFAQAAVRALGPMSVPVVEGGTLAELEGFSCVQEYPTDRPSCVLNGAIFALWGYYDVGRTLGDAEAAERFERLVTALASNLWRYDIGYWSRYDLYPHPVANVASPAYHLLHIKQLRILHQQAPRPELGATASRFEAYRSSRVRRARAVGHKVVFRMVVPRNRVLAHRLPWNRYAPARRAHTHPSDVLVLCYHAVSPDWPAALSVTPQQLADQLQYLSDRGYKGATFSEAIHGQVAGRVVAVTFDDGFRSVVQLARPILEQFEMPATVFVPSNFVGRDEPMAWPGIDRWVGGKHEHELVPMSWPEARSLVAAGWEIGSHTKSHPRLSALSDDQLEDELVGSKRECERMLDSPCHSIAYPYGDQDGRVIAATAAAGYSAAGTLPAGHPVPLPLSWPRVGIYHVDSKWSFRLKVSPTARRLRRSRAWGPLMRVARPVARRGPVAQSETAS
jgi:peptidoglycan/xylan/chitin deacetylase (PgdA/CDA1 family)